MAAKLAAEYYNQWAYHSKDLDWYRYANGLWVLADQILMDKAIREAVEEMHGDCVGTNFLKNVKTQLGTHVPQPFDPPPRYLIPFRNTVLNIRTMESSAHNPTHYFTWQLPYEYDPNAGCPTVRAWLKSLVQNDDVMF